MTLRPLSRRLPFALLLTLAACGGQGRPSSRYDGYSVPPDSQIPPGPLGDSIRRGRAITVATRRLLPGHVGNALRCSSCHLQAGTRREALPWVGVYGTFPQYRSRSGRVARLEDRINDCFVRSLNGRALAEGSGEMTDLVSYIAFLSRHTPAGVKPAWLGLGALDPAAGDAAAGARVFAAQCAVCHGNGGAGGDKATPLWGPRSFALGAAMARRGVLAAFVRQNMPSNSPGTVSAAEAADVAAFVLAHERPPTSGMEHDWPNGDAPEDVPYKTRAARGGTPD